MAVPIRPPPLQDVHWNVAHSGGASTLLGHLPREGSLYRGSHCHLNGTLKALMVTRRPHWPCQARHALRNGGKDGGRVSVQSGTLETWQDITFRPMLGPEPPTKRNLTFHIYGCACHRQLCVVGNKRLNPWSIRANKDIKPRVAG